MNYFEDFQVGETFELGSTTVTEEEIIAFARQFDPQPFHLSPELARESPYRPKAARMREKNVIFWYIDNPKLCAYT